MSTFVDIKRVIDKDKKTTIIRLDDDLKISIRSEISGAPTDSQFNFTGLQEGQMVSPNDPQDVINSIQVAKDGTEEVAIIGVNVYHAEDEHDTVPAEGQYWYNPDNQYWPSTAAQPGKTLAADPSFKNVVQTFPETIFNISGILTQHPFRTGNSVGATTISNDDLRNYRRSQLKMKLNAILNHDLFMSTMDGASLVTVITPSSTTVPSSGGDVIEVKELARRRQAFWFRLEMLTRAVAIDSNITNNQRFSLLDGEISINFQDVFKKINPALNGLIAVTGDNRTGWNFHRLGSVASSSPYAYTAPVLSTAVWNSTLETSINIATPPDEVTDNWIGWLRT